MTRPQLIKRLTALPALISDHEHALLRCKQDAIEAEEALADREAALLFPPPGEEPVINGSNADARKAQLRQATTRHRETLRTTQHAVDRQRIERDRLLNDFKGLRAVARLLGGDDEETPPLA